MFHPEIYISFKAIPVRFVAFPTPPLHPLFLKNSLYTHKQAEECLNFFFSFFFFE